MGTTRSDVCGVTFDTTREKLTRFGHSKDGQIDNSFLIGADRSSLVESLRWFFPFLCARKEMKMKRDRDEKRQRWVKIKT